MWGSCELLRLNYIYIYIYIYIYFHIHEKIYTYIHTQARFHRCKFTCFTCRLISLSRRWPGKKEKKEPQNRQVLKGQPKIMVCDTCRARDSEAPRRACDSELQTVLQVNARANRHLFAFFSIWPISIWDLPFCTCPIWPISDVGPYRSCKKKKRWCAPPRFGSSCVFSHLQSGLAALGFVFGR